MVLNKMKVVYGYLVQNVSKYFEGFQIVVSIFRKMSKQDVISHIVLKKKNCTSL